MKRPSHENVDTTLGLALKTHDAKIGRTGIEPVTLGLKVPCSTN